MSDNLNKEKDLSCAFTGHRIIREDFNSLLFERTVENLITQGVTTFYSGMAMGFDLIAADAVLKEKERNSQIKLIACVPCPEQQRNYPLTEKKKYERIIALCDEVVILSERYYKGCMLARDRYMVDNCDVVLAYMNKLDGGTAYTVRYAQSKRKKIFIT